MKMREKGKQEKKSLRMNKSKENTLIYMHMYIHTQTYKQIYTDTDTHIYISTLCVIQVR